MTRSLGSGILADVQATTGERCQLIALAFADLSNNPTPVYITTASADLVWNAHTWQAVGGSLDIDALGESSDGGTSGHTLRLCGVDQSILALILGSRWRGRNATIYHASLDPAAGTVRADPVVMFSGPMNGGFQVSESRGDFGGGAVDITARLTARLDELVKVRGVRTNVASHRAAIPGASADTFFQNVDNLPLRKVYWGTKSPSTTGATPPVQNPIPNGGPGGGSGPVTYPQGPVSIPNGAPGGGSGPVTYPQGPGPIPNMPWGPQAGGPTVPDIPPANIDPRQTTPTVSVPRFP